MSDAQGPIEPTQRPTFLAPSPLPEPGDELSMTDSDGTNASRWPARLGVISALVGFVLAQLAIAVIAVIFLAFGGDIDGSGFLVIASILQSFVFIGTAAALARTVGPVRVRDFGLLRAPLASSAGKTLLIALIYFGVVALYAAAVDLSPDSSPDKLGANKGALGMIGFVVMAALIAPIAEEVFFRGMIYRSLKNGIGVWGGAAVSGLFFGALHIDSLGSERLLQVVPLMLLGVLFALLYAWSGTIFTTIALHATNNAIAVIAYASDNDSSLGVSLGAATWLLVIAFCVFGSRLTDRRRDGDDGPPIGPSTATFASAPERPFSAPPPHGSQLPPRFLK